MSPSASCVLPGSSVHRQVRPGGGRCTGSGWAWPEVPGQVQGLTERRTRVTSCRDSGKPGEGLHRLPRPLMSETQGPRPGDSAGVGRAPSHPGLCRVCPCLHLSPRLRVPVHCPVGSEWSHSQPCPAGYYCPAGTHSPRPCPTGTFRNSSQAGAAGDCLPCPVDTFGARPGQTGCLPCGSSAFSAPGESPAPTCPALKLP